MRCFTQQMIQAGNWLVASSGLHRSFHDNLDDVLHFKLKRLFKVKFEDSLKLNPLREIANQFGKLLAHLLMLSMKKKNLFAFSLGNQVHKSCLKSCIDIKLMIYY